MAVPAAYKRCLSCSNIEQVIRNEKRERQRMPDKPIHGNTDSLFSTDSGFTNYKGLFHLIFILLFISSARLCIENLIKYGLLVDWQLKSIHFFMCGLVCQTNILILAFVWEIMGLQILVLVAILKRLDETFAVAVSVANGAVQLILPAFLVLRLHPPPLFSSGALMIVTVMFLKLISYAHTNYWCRKVRYLQQAGSLCKQLSAECVYVSGDERKYTNSVSEHLVKYPDNINLSDILYFLVAPTLCYELNFPRSARIRKRFLIKRITEMCFFFLMISALTQQWIVPAINNAMNPLSEMDIGRIVERLLKLAIPNHLVWLMGFYVFFHSCLNVLAELTKFGDREFYRDWWNCETVLAFWQNWNIPAHRWCTRHLYKPMRRHNVGKIPAMLSVFLISAFFHEYLVSAPLCMFKVWAFSGMLMQMPLAYVTGKWLNGKWGNIVVWLSIILGQPIAILAYVHDYYISTMKANGGTPIHPFNQTYTILSHDEF